MRPVARGVVAGAILLGGAIAAATAPGTTGILAPFAVYGAPGESVAARRLTVEVLDVRVAERLSPEYDVDAAAFTTSGVWVVVDCIITPRFAHEGLHNLELEIGDRTFRIEDVLPSPSVASLPYGAGVPVQGPLVFQIPESALSDSGASAARLVFHTGLDSRLESVPVVTVDLAALDVEAEAVVTQAFVPDADD